MKKLLGIFFLFFFGLGGIGSGCFISGIILLLCALSLLPIKAIENYKNKYLQALYNKMLLKQPKLSFEKFQKTNKILFSTVICITLLFILAKVGEPTTTTSNNTEGAAKQTEYTQEQKDATIKLIEGLKSSEAGLIVKIVEYDPGCWNFIINEKAWEVTPYENKQMLAKASKIYAQIKNPDTFNYVKGKGSLTDKYLFDEYGLR